MVVTLQSRLLRHIQTLDLTYGDDHPVGETLSRMTNDVIASRSLVTSGLPALLKSLVSFVGAAIIMLVLDWQMALVTLLVVPVLAVMSWQYRRVAAPRFLAFRDAIAGVTISANDSLGVVDVIQAFNQTEREQAGFAAATLESRDAEYRTIRANAVYYPATTLLSATATGLLVTYGGIQVVRGNSEVGTMVAFFGYLSMFLTPLVNFSSLFKTYQSGIAAVDKIFSVLAEPPAAESRDLTRLEDGPGRVVVTRVRLPVQEQPATSRIDLEVEGGSMVAIVGESGSGRRFMGRILAGLVAPDEGFVTVDGTDIHRVRRTALYHEVAYVSADGRLFDGTVRDNLALGVGAISDEDLLTALEGLFGTSDPLGELVAGLDTKVGRNGRNLPAGMRNRILIARGLLREPRLLILDDATDSLDAHSLHHFAHARAHQPGLTIIAVTRQPLIARHADRVVVIAHGSVVEDGTHADLLRTGGEYARLCSAWEHGRVR